METEMWEKLGKNERNYKRPNIKAKGAQSIANGQQPSLI